MPSVPMTMIGPEHVRQQLCDHDAQIAVAQHLCRLHIALALERQRRRPRDPAGEGPVGQPERDQQAGQAGSKDRHDGEREDQRRDRQHEVGQAVDEVVPPAAPIARGQARGVTPMTLLINCETMPTVSEMRAP